MSFRGRNGFNRTIFYGGPRNPWNSIFFEEPAISWARFIIGTTVHCQELQGHRKIWFEYNPWNRIGDLLSSLKDFLGITADVKLYLQGFLIPPHLNASFLLQVHEPIYLLEHGQTEFAFGPEGTVPGQTFQPADAAEVCLFSPPRTSTPVDPNREREEAIIPGNLNLQGAIAQGNPVVTLITTPNIVTSPTVTVVQISELNSPGPTDSASEAASPLVRVREGFSRGRKSGNKSESPMKDENLPLEYSTVANENIPVRRSSRRLSKSLTTNEGESLNRKRTSLAHVENVPPQAAKRLKSTTGKNTDNSDVNVSDGFPIMKKHPGRKSKKSTNSVAELPSLVSVSVVLEDVLLANKKTETASSGDTTTESTDIMEIEWQSSLIQEENLEITQAEAIDCEPIEEATTQSMSQESITGEITEISNERDHNLSCTMQSQEDELKNQGIGTPQHMKHGVITSAASIEPGNVIQADMVITGEDGNPTVTTKVMQVLAKYNETVSVQIPSRTLGEINTADDISQCSCCSPHGVFSVSFKDLIRPQLLDEAQLQDLLDAHNLATHY